MAQGNKKLKHFWPYWLLPLSHFVVVTTAAFAVHYSNGINVRDFTGDYGLWMDVGNLAIDAFQVTRWAIPIILLFILLRANEKKGASVCFIAAASVVLIATWPLYFGLINFWERHWIPA